MITIWFGDTLLCRVTMTKYAITNELLRKSAQMKSCFPCDIPIYNRKCDTSLLQMLRCKHTAVSVK